MASNDESEYSSGQSTCAYFVSRKKRYCRMLVSKGKKFCGQHLVNEDQKQDDLHKRIPCPLDSKHSCFKHKLSQHLKCCNAREQTDIPFQSMGINEGENEEEPSRIQLKSLSDSDLLNYISRIQEVHKKYIGQIEERMSNHSVLNEALSRTDCGPSIIRHLKQNSSLIAYLEDKNLLNFKGSKVFVEFGAGRGQLTGWLNKAVKDKENSAFLLVDKGSQRYKVDSKLKQREKLKIRRIRIDIQDLNLSKIDDIQNESVLIACGKHLCGAATDFSLRCLMRCGKGTVGGIVIALCCHHKCTWKSYTGKEFFKAAGFSPKDFSVLLSLSSWTVSGARYSTHVNDGNRKMERSSHEREQMEKEGCSVENRYTRMGLSVAFREEIGRKAKQIIDMGRVCFLRNFSLDASLIQYVDQSSTLENIALVAVQK